MPAVPSTFIVAIKADEGEIWQVYREWIDLAVCQISASGASIALRSRKFAKSLIFVLILYYISIQIEKFKILFGKKHVEFFVGVFLFSSKSCLSM